MKTLRNFALALVLVAFVGCSDQALLTEPSDSAVASDVTTASKQHDANATVYRSDVHWASSWNDSQSGLRATHTTVPLGNPTETDCGLTEPGDPIGRQDVVRDAGGFLPRIHRIVKGDVWIIVRDLNQPGDCFGATLVAQGPGKLLVRDNDVFGGISGGENMNTFGWHGHGNLTTPDGSSVTYAGHLIMTYDGENVNTRSAKVDVQ